MTSSGHTQSGCREKGPNHQNNTLDHSFEHCTAVLDSSKYLIISPSPHNPPRIISHDECFQAFPVFRWSSTNLLLLCITVNGNKGQNGERLGTRLQVSQAWTILLLTSYGLLQFHTFSTCTYHSPTVVANTLRWLVHLLTLPALKNTLDVPKQKSFLFIPIALNSASQKVLGSRQASFGGRKDLYLRKMRYFAYVICKKAKFVMYVCI